METLATDEAGIEVLELLRDTLKTDNVGVLKRLKAHPEGVKALATPGLAAPDAARARRY